MIQMLKILKLKNMYDYVNILSPAIYFFIILELEKKVDNRIRMYTLMLIHTGHARESFRDVIIFFAPAVPF